MYRSTMYKKPEKKTENQKTERKKIDISDQYIPITDYQKFFFLIDMFFYFYIAKLSV